MLTNLFIGDEENFCDHHPLTVEAAFKDTPHGTAPPAIVASRTLANYGTYSKVVSQYRVVYFRIQPGNVMFQGKVGKEYDNSLSVCLYANNPGGDAAPCYFLPYLANETYRITLKDKRGGPGLAPVNHFFTEQLDGCSVFIEGDPTQPTVFHLNAKSHGAFTGKYKSDLQVRAEKERFMSEMFTNTPAPKSVREGVNRGQVPQGTALMPSAYMGMDPKDLKRIGKQFMEEFDLPERRVTTDTKATVFGVRNVADGKWSFYCQTKVCLMYERLHEKFMFKPDHYQVEGFYWAPLTVTKFYPGGGQSVIRPNVSRVV